MARLPLGATGLQTGRDKTASVALPANVATVSPFGGASASTPTVWLDSYYDSGSYANKSAAIQAAHDAAVAGRAILECQAKRVYLLDTAPLQLKPSSPIIIEGHGATFKATWGKPRCIDFVRTADGQTFTNIDVRDLIFDANNLTSGTSESVVGTTLNGGSVSTYQRINFQHIYFRRCQWVNVPTSTTPAGNSYGCFQIIVSQVATGQPEAQNTITDIRLEQAYMRGGNYGVNVQATSTGGSAAVNVYHDRIYLDFDWDSGVVQNGGSTVAGGNQIGSLGYGDYCEVHAIIANAGDVGLEIDGMQTAVVTGRATDCRNSAYFVRNFHAPPSQAGQTVIWRDCEARVESLNPTTATYPAQGFAVGHTVTPVVGFGRAIIENCKFYSAATNFSGAGLALGLGATGSLVNEIMVVGSFSAVWDKVNYLPGGTDYGYPIYLVPAGTTRFTVKGKIDVSVAGAGNANSIAYFVYLSPNGGGNTLILDVDDVELSQALTGIAVGGTYGMLLGAFGGTMRGTIGRLAWGAVSGGDTSPHLLQVYGSGTVTVDGRILIGSWDTRAAPNGNLWIVSDATNQAKVKIDHVLLPSASYPPAAAGITPGASPYAYQNLDGYREKVAVSGGTVSAIAYSVDGATYTTLGTTAGVFTVEPGDYLKVTYSGTPTMTKIPVT